MSLHHSQMTWERDEGEPFDAIAQARFRARPEWSAAAFLSDAAERGHDTPARRMQRALVASVERASRGERSGAAAGLVSVPTSGTPRVQASAALSEAIKRGEVADLRAQLGAFVVDHEERRLSRLRMQVGFAARGHAVCERGHRSDDCLMVTLTYRGDNSDWKPRHISDYLKVVRQWMKRRDIPCRYVWVAELQQRGVIHYHVALWVPKGTRLPKADARGWWPHGMTRTEKARAAVPYLLKYLSKQTSKTFGSFPHGSRIYGIGGLDHSIRRARRWLGLPSFVQANSSINDGWKRAEGGGWLSPSGGHYASEFRRFSVGGSHALVRVVTHGRAIDAAGPFSWLTDGPCKS